MFLRLILMAFLLPFSFPTLAKDSFENPDNFSVIEGPVIFVGQLRKTTLYPRDWSNSGETCGLIDENENEYCEVFVSNACGTEIMVFDVIEAISGTLKGNSISLKTTLGEWCNSSVNLTSEQKIVFAFPETVSPGESFVYSFDLYCDENSHPYFFLDSPGQFEMCSNTTGLDCYSLLFPVEPIYFDLEDDAPSWAKELLDLEILTKNEKGEIFLVKAIFVKDLK